MVAIITNNIKKILVQDLLDQYEDSNNFFHIGIGRSEDWNETDTAPVPTNTEREQKRFRYSLQSIKAVTGASFVVPRYNWISGSTYTPFNDNVVGQPANSYYVITDENNVYVCIRQGKDTNGNAVVSSSKPTHTNTSLPVQSDGYIWKFLYTITVANANAFLSAAYMPVELIDSAAISDPFYNQYLIQNAAIPGQIVGYRVTNAGSGFTSDPTITVIGDGSGARARPIVTSAKTIGAIEVDDSAGGVPLGTGYSYANITITGGGGGSATAVPIFGPAAGLGADPRDDLRANAIMFNVKATGTENDDWVIGNDFRQIGLLRNITYYDSDGVFTETQGRALKAMNLSSITGTFEPDQLVTGGTSGAVAYVDYFKSPSTIWYHQTETTGFEAFQDGEGVSTSSGSATADSASVAPEINPFSGDLLFIDNRPTPITRSNDQTEDIKIVVQL